MAFDPQALLAMDPIVTHHIITPRDTMLYALGVGARQLDFIYEETLEALPTMAVVLAYPGFFWRDPAFGVTWQKVLHGEQSTRIHAPLPVEGTVRGETRIEAIYDKGADKGSLAFSAREIYDEDGGTHLATVRMSSFLRGDGGHGGSDGEPPRPHPVPDREADAVVTLPTAANQAEIYRLSGDYNPLHIDPAVAEAAGFAAPILHGLCTYGVVGRALLAELCDNDPTRLTRMDVRFSSPVYPGETIVTEIWREGDGSASFRARAAERDLVVINNGYAEFR
ncbi:MaoC family dehydratase [Pseudopontixanthobacter vadosimaris]|uniref:MaoC family dehydratase n=1 Tax=Pseudopontixanthobacter vadosimaris TaxID=2726450 RepID=UPI001474DFC3|nr:MaoC family dehydratase [Pseudopontixanthobacter vadosimaris]